MDDKRSFENTYLSQPVMLEDGKRGFEFTYFNQLVLLEIEYQILILAYIYIIKIKWMKKRALNTPI